MADEFASNTTNIVTLTQAQRDKGFGSCTALDGSLALSSENFNAVLNWFSGLIIDLTTRSDDAEDRLDDYDQDILNVEDRLDIVEQISTVSGKQSLISNEIVDITNVTSNVIVSTSTPFIVTNPSVDLSMTQQDPITIPPGGNVSITLRSTITTNQSFKCNSKVNVSANAAYFFGNTVN